MKHMFKTLLFDVDGTLLDFNAAEEAGLRWVLSQYARDFPEEEMMASYRVLNRKLWDAYEQGVISKDQITDTRFVALFQEFGVLADGREAERRYRDCLNRCAIVVDGAVQTLEYLKNRYELYVVTNGFVETQTMRMRDSGLDRYFRRSFISEGVGDQKPQKEFFDYCFDHMAGAVREETLIIGDSLNSDMKGGNNAGIHTCWYNPAKEPLDGDIQVDITIESLTELMELL